MKTVNNENTYLLFKALVSRLNLINLLLFNTNNCNILILHQSTLVKGLSVNGARSLPLLMAVQCQQIWQAKEPSLLNGHECRV